ncbi:hypothetical protein MTO96_029540 [Rhipicephalus appendiculatus]
MDLPSNLQRKTDYSPPAVSVSGNPERRSCKGTWRIDPALLNDEDSVETLKTEIRTGRNNEVLAYADDFSLFVRDPRSLQAFDSIFSAYAEVSGAAINRPKSKALLFGPFPSDSLGEIQRVHAVQVLGVYFICEGVAAAAWKKSVERATEAVERAQQLDLTLRKKALAAKSAVCAFANYASRVGVIPNKLPAS